MKVSPAQVRQMAARGLIPAASAPAESEGDFQKRVLDLARGNGWLVVHVPRVTLRRRREAVHMTAIVGDGKGFVDAVLVREKVLFREFKSAAGRLRPEQVKWRDRLLAAGADWACWRPADWAEIVEVLA